MNIETNEIYYNFSDKWSADIEEFNFTQVPNLLLGCQGHLHLTDGELLTLIHLQTFWYSNGSRIFPSITTLTKFSHKGYSTIQARLMKLEKKGFIKRSHTRGTSNTYSLTPCVERLNRHIQVCKNPPRKQGEQLVKVGRVAPSFLMTKEYEALTRPTLTNTLQEGTSADETRR